MPERYLFCYFCNCTNLVMHQGTKPATTCFPPAPLLRETWLTFSRLPFFCMHANWARLVRWRRNEEEIKQHAQFWRWCITHTRGKHILHEEYLKTEPAMLGFSAAPALRYVRIIPADGFALEQFQLQVESLQFGPDVIRTHICQSDLTHVHVAIVAC